MSAEETAIERVEENLKTVEKKVDSINTALYGTGNPHGGLFAKIEGLEGKFTALEVKIGGVESKLEAKIDGVEKIFDKMFGLFKWSVGIAAVPFCAIAIPIFIEIVLPIIRKWMGISVIAMALIWTDATTQAQFHIEVYPSQDDPTKTLWIFVSPEDGSPANYTSTIRSSGNYHARDSWQLGNSDRNSSTPPTSQPMRLSILLPCFPAPTTQKTSSP